MEYVFSNNLSCFSSFCADAGGYRNISNELSIGTKIDRMSDGLASAAQEKGLWDGSGEFNFRAAFASEDDYGGGRKECGEKLLAKLSEGGKCVVIVLSGVVMSLLPYRICLVVLSSHCKMYYILCISIFVVIPIHFSSICLICICSSSKVIS